MSKGQVLVVDWKNKKLLTNQHNNSDDSFYQNKQTICDGEVTLFTTKNSGGNWQMRMRVEGHRQYHQKSLRTKNYETAKERAFISCNVYNNENVKLLKTKGVTQIEQSRANIIFRLW